MAFAFRALRFARCRNAALSSWARRVNTAFDTKRGMASVAVLQLSAEQHPLATFAERSSTDTSLAETSGNESSANESDPLQALIESILSMGPGERAIIDLHSCNSRTCLIPICVIPVMISQGKMSGLSSA
mmetsp:Transcript_12880/g.30168  ORF Transcript_12880/g.30168 Transcript_12880/m.30168 type:complete len:130 (-) Transcript_12880:22-411(-)|eukprot:CAMPEP_0178430580 /NCGR_PEP_ID=MMETSP0689_2-20121128/31396_1 /TAXON_ID=160604 /ORGANISM="Amphidinium massartii, Strain CS-259" /LENGTH=129 /DNA_ID=CAMNT_0020052447 /DNA_START=78 /DNA_END=467 /DNA_ORIENTATION=-